MTRLRDHATVEQTLLTMCHQVGLDAGEWKTLEWLQSRPFRANEASVYTLPVRFWRAFYLRSPELMLGAQVRDVLDLARQFKAQDDVKVAMAAMDAVLSSRTAFSAPSGSATDR